MSISSLFHCCTAGIPLTPCNVMRVVSEVEKWWGGIGSGSLADSLYIPESKQEEIRQKFSDEVEQKKQAISYWINTDPLASWIRLITALEEMGQARLANSIQSNAEPPTGIVFRSTDKIALCLVVATHRESHKFSY